VAPPAGADVHAKADESGTTRASELMETEIVVKDGQTLGKVADLIIDNRSGQVGYVVVETDNEYRAIPWKTLALQQGEGDQPDERYFAIDMDRDQFVQAPAIPQAQYRTYSRAQWNTYIPGVVKFYGNVRPAEAGQIRRAQRNANEAGRAAANGNPRKAVRKANEAERKTERAVD
jgi:sporulation protein YlmC with PRC-barrel domain